MSRVAICTDASALFPPGAAARLGVAVVPIGMTINGEPYDAREDEIDDFYARLSAGAIVTTSQPSPGQLLETYASAAAAGAEEALSIHLDARVSGTTASAELAASDAPIPVTVVDTGTVSFGVGACVRAAAEAVATGAAAAEASAAARRLGPRLRNVFVAPGAPGGRIGDAPGCAVLELVEGKAQACAACDNLEEAAELMAERIGREHGLVRAAVGHAGAVTEPAADALARSLAARSHVVEVERYRVGAAVGAHTGPLSFGAFWWPAG
jgi:DegV family protein with EDD domain